jgi:HAD superfamily hydrolase (TIGR01509 family)
VKKIPWPYRAVLFDMDGTLTNNAHFHDLAWRAIMQERFGYRLAEHDQRVHGGKTADIVFALTGQRLLGAEAEDFHQAKEAQYRDLARGHITAIAGLSDYLAWLAAKAIPIALVTSADATNTEFVLSALGLAETFGIRVLGEDVLHGKPHPEPFLLGAERLGVAITDCLVHEDSLAGVGSGVAAGAVVAGISSNQPASALAEAGAQFVVGDYVEWLEMLG